jgi:hypothetical protein
MTQAETDHETREGASGKHARPWFLLPWMVVVSLILFACGQLALVLRAAPGTADTRSNLSADYSPWSFMPMAPLDPAFLVQLASDLEIDPSIVDSPVCLLPGSECQASPTASVTPPLLGATQDPPGSGVDGTPTTTRTPWLGGAPPRATPTDGGGPSNPAPSAMPTNTPETPTNTPTNTSEPPPATNTPTVTPVTPTPCVGNCEPDVGPPDGTYATLIPGTTLDFYLPTPIVVDGSGDWDLVYYERRNVPYTEILLDLVVVKIGLSSTGEWYVVFDWGNGIIDANSSVSAVPEGPNAPIPLSTLYGTPPYNTGILINVDITTVPTGVYDRVSITGPTPGVGTPAYGAGDLAEVDAIEVLPTPTPP